MAVVTDAIFGLVMKRQNEPWTQNSLPEMVAYGIEAALAWRPDAGEVLEVSPAFQRWMRPATEEDVITGAHQRRYEQELEDQLDTVLRYARLRDSWIPQSDTEAWVELRNLGLEVEEIAKARKIRRGIT